MVRCDGCKLNEGKHHVTMRLEVFSAETTKTKFVQFWLCDGCESASRMVLARDEYQAERVARRLVEEPGFLTKYREWRERRIAR